MMQLDKEDVNAQRKREREVELKSVYRSGLRDKLDREFQQQQRDQKEAEKVVESVQTGVTYCAKRLL